MKGGFALRASAIKLCAFAKSEKQRLRERRRPNVFWREKELIFLRASPAD